MSFSTIYRHRTTQELVQVKNLGLGEKKIRKPDGSEEKITNGKLQKEYVFESAMDKRIGNIARKMKTKISKPKRII